MRIDPQPWSYTARGGKIIDKITLQTDISFLSLLRTYGLKKRGVMQGNCTTPFLIIVLLKVSSSEFFQLGIKPICYQNQER